VEEGEKKTKEKKQTDRGKQMKIKENLMRVNLREKKVSRRENKKKKKKRAFLPTYKKHKSAARDPPIINNKHLAHQNLSRGERKEEGTSPMMEKKEKPRRGTSQKKGKIRKGGRE